MKAIKDEMRLEHVFVNETDRYKCTVKVFRPVLSEEEYERRHKRLEKAVADFAKYVIREKGSLDYDKTTDK